MAAALAGTACLAGAEPTAARTLSYAPRKIEAGIATFRLTGMRPRQITAAKLRDANGASARIPLRWVRVARRGTLRVRLASLRWNRAGSHRKVWLVVSTDRAPTVTLTSAPPPATESADARFEFKSTAASATRCRLDARPWRRCRSPVTYAAVSVGTHRFFVRVSSFVGSDSASAAWTVSRPAASPEPPPPLPQPPPPPPPPPTGCNSWHCFSNPFNLPAAGWRPYLDGAAWNRGTAGASVHANSAAMVEYLRSTSAGRMQNIAVPDDSGSAPVYWADVDDPLYTIRCREWISSCEVHGVKARIPAGALPTGAADRHLVSVQPDGTEVDLWEADVPSGRGGDLYVSHGGMTRIDGDGTGSGAVAANTGTMGGQFRSPSWMADTIRHALQLVIDRDNGSYVYPALKRGSSDPAVSRVPMGQWFKLNLTDAELAAEPPWRRALYRAARDYGLFVVDTGARPIAIQHENPRTYTSFGAQDPAWSWLRGQTGVDDYVNTTTGTLNMVAKTPSFPFDKLVALKPPPRP